MDWFGNKTGQLIAFVGIVSTLAGFVVSIILLVIINYLRSSQSSK